MLRQMSHLFGHGVGGGHVVEDHYRALEASGRIMDRRGGIFDGGLAAIAADQYRAGRQQFALIVLQHLDDGVGHRLAAFIVDQVHHAVDRQAMGFVELPASHMFGGAVEVVDVALQVGTDYRITDRVEGQ